MAKKSYKLRILASNPGNGGYYTTIRLALIKGFDAVKFTTGVVPTTIKVGTEQAQLYKIGRVEYATKALTSDKDAVLCGTIFTKHSLGEKGDEITLKLDEAKSFEEQLVLLSGDHLFVNLRIMNEWLPATITEQELRDVAVRINQFSQSMGLLGS